MPQAFISHAKTDAKQAADIAAALEARGVPWWIAPRDVEPGRNFGDEIIRGIEACPAFILVLSQASNGSDFVAKELATAVDKRKTVIPSASKRSSPDLRSPSSLPVRIGSTRSLASSAGKPIAWRACYRLRKSRSRQSLSLRNLLRGRAGGAVPRWQWRRRPV